MRLPKEIRGLFWDIDADEGSPHQHKKYYIARILDKGNKNAISWLFKLFGKETVKRSVSRSRLSPRSANYWQKFFHLT